MSVLSSMLFLVPWLTSNWANVTVYGIIGGTLAVLMIGNEPKFYPSYRFKIITSSYFRGKRTVL